MLVEHLQNYLDYMQSLNYSGLQLSHQPFYAMPAPHQTGRAPTPPPHLAQTPRKVPQAIQPAKPKPPKQTKTAPGQPSALFSLVDMVDMVSPEQENRKKAEAIKGENATDTLRKLYGAFCDCEACPLGTTRNKFVFGEGPSDADLMFIGEGPGRDEDLSGRPFVGRAGQLLDKIIVAMGFRRDQVFIANVVKCRPPGNRTPLPDEMAACSPILKKQVEAVNPKMIVVLGSTALKYFAGGNASIMRMRGSFMEWESRRIMPTFHPAYILRNPRAKREVWEDMKKVMAVLTDKG